MARGTAASTGCCNRCPMSRRRAARRRRRRFLARAGAAFSAEERERFVAQALALFADPRFAALFAAGSRAEVPIVGRLAARRAAATVLVSGQIDRLVVTDGCRADRRLQDQSRCRRAASTRRRRPMCEQLALYRAVLGRIYPDRPVRAALVWTEIPDLMEIPAAMLDEAIARVAAWSPSA